MEVEPMGMYYSVKAFEETGLSENDLPKTWDDFLALAHKLTKGNRFGCLFETTPGYYQTFTWYPFMWQGGGDIVASDGKKSAFNSPATVQALKFWQDSIQQNIASRNFLGGGVWDVVANRASGYCAMQNVGIWGISALSGRTPKIFSTACFPYQARPAVGQHSCRVGFKAARRSDGNVG
jgi:multiple sugar transport system substrate-binding protein